MNDQIHKETKENLCYCRHWFGNWPRGIKLLRSEEAKKVYQKVAAAGLTITTRVIDKAKSLKKDEKPKE